MKPFCNHIIGKAYVIPLSDWDTRNVLYELELLHANLSVQQLQEIRKKQNESVHRHRD